MKSKLYLLPLILLLSFCKVQGPQLSKSDTVLYILFDPLKYKRSDFKAVIRETLEERWENRYVFWRVRLYDGYPLEFLSIDKREARTVTYKELKELPVVTVEKLHQFISENYKGSEKHGYYGSSYFDNLKHIYLVEKDEKAKTATITEVRLDITIE